MCLKQEEGMNSEEAKIFIVNWFDKVWTQSSIDNLRLFYDENVKVTANGTLHDREDLIKHCKWCKENEKISKIDFVDVIAENNIIAFRFKYEYSSKEKTGLSGENIGIMHLNKDKKIIQIDVKSNRIFSTEQESDW
jgi:hypothetical protein